VSLFGCSEKRVSRTLSFENFHDWTAGKIVGVRFAHLKLHSALALGEQRKVAVILKGDDIEEARKRRQRHTFRYVEGLMTQPTRGAFD
jgi:hypothetical protein